MSISDDVSTIAEPTFGGMPFESAVAAPAVDPTDPTTDPGDLNTAVGDGENIAFNDTSSLGASLTGDGLQINDAIQGLEDLGNGQYYDAIGEGASVVGNYGLHLLDKDIPGINGAGAVISDLIDGHYGDLPGDAEKAGIETATSYALGLVGTAVAGPVGSFIGSTVGDFVGDAIAPAVEDAVSDTWDTGENIVDDTVSSFEDAGDDIGDGDVLGAVGDVVDGVAEDSGDALEGAYDLTGDGLEAVADLGTQTWDLGEDVADDTETGVEDAGEGIEDAADAVGDGVEDAVDDVGDALDDLF